MEQILKHYDVVIGIEVHCQLATATKIFSRSGNQFGCPPNSLIDPTATGLPGALPVINGFCVDLAIRMGLATHCAIQPVSIFTRKNYFYPDLPKGYQITQLDHPICTDGHVTLTSGKKIRIQRIQLEEDAGKNLHIGNASLVDYNRSGVGLIEIVSHPDVSSPEEAVEYLKHLHNLAVHLEISDGNMEEGNFRADANVSLKPKGQVALGQRTEIKNVNSFRYLEKAIHYEIKRQFEILRTGGTIDMETRGYDSDKDETFTQRSKENAPDYRYFPEPDLPPLVVTAEHVARVAQQMPELPAQRQLRYERDLQLPTYDAALISQWKVGAQYFEDLVKSLQSQNPIQAKVISNYYMTEVLRAVKVTCESKGLSLEQLDQVPIPLAHSQQLLTLVAQGTISARMAKDVFEDMMANQESPESLVQKKGLVQITDDKNIVAIIDQVMTEHHQRVLEYQQGKQKLFGFFVGEAMKKSQGTLNPQKLSDLLRQKLTPRP